MNTVTKLITYATASNSGTFAGHPYDLYKQIRYNARRVPLHRLKNPPGSSSPWINRSRRRKAKRPISDRPYIFVFYRYDESQKGPPTGPQLGNA